MRRNLALFYGIVIMVLVVYAYFLVLTRISPRLFDGSDAGFAASVSKTPPNLGAFQHADDIVLD